MYVCVCVCVCMCTYVYACNRHKYLTIRSSRIFQPFPACTQRSCPPRPHICPAAGMKAGRVRRKKRRKGEDGGTEEEPPKARGATCCDGICTEKHH